MNRKFIQLIPFFVMVLVQLTIPIGMIFSYEHVIYSGVSYRFRTAPIDPEDPFRGKYINLNFDNTLVVVENDTTWLSNDVAYAILDQDEEGFAMVRSLSREEPVEGEDYLKVKIRYTNFYSSEEDNTVVIEYPFHRFYMEESKAYEAEMAYIDAQGADEVTTYATVFIQEGKGVIENVYIGDVPIAEVVQRSRDANAE